MTRRVQPEQASDGGFTLTELLVSIGVFGVVSAMVTTASIAGLHQQTQVQNRADALAQMRTALQRIDRDIRSTYPLLSASSTSLVLREVQATVTRVMTYAVSGTNLVVSERDTSSGGTTTTIPTKTLLKNLVDTSTSPVFSYAPVNGYAAPAGSGVNSTTCAMSGGAYDAGCVGTVTVRVTVHPPYLAASVTMSDNGIELRNAA